MKKETLYKIFEMAEKEHLNLFHDISKEDLYKEIDSLAQKLDSLTVQETNFELMKIGALLKDAHSGFYLEKDFIPCTFEMIDNDFYLINTSIEYVKYLYKKLNKINGIQINEILKLAKKVTHYETEEWFIFNFLTNLKDLNFLKMIGVVANDNNFVNYTFENCSKSIKVIKSDNSKLATNYKIRAQNYEVKLKDNIKYIRYTSCKEDKNYSLENFYLDVNNLLSKNDNIVFDLRDNTGGNSNLIKPIIKIFEEKQINGFCLMNKGTFSSGRFAVADAVKCGFKLVGENTGAAIKCYGNIKKLVVDDNIFYVSQNYYDFSKIFNYAGPIVPDFIIKYTLNDYVKNIDPVFEYAKSAIYKTLMLD